MARNKQMDLNNMLFEQMERLNDDEYMSKNGDLEIKRAKEISNVGKTIIMNMKLALDVSKHQEEYGLTEEYMPKLISNE